MVSFFFFIENQANFPFWNW